MAAIVSSSWFIYTLLLLVLVSLVYFRARVFGLASRIVPDQQAYNNVVMATCALLTLAWGAYTFDALQQRSKAEAELLDLQKRLRDTESTLLNVAVGVDSTSKDFYLTPVVTIKNVGTEALYFRLCKDSLSVSKISYNLSGKLKSVNTLYPQFYQVISGDPKLPHSPFYDVRVPISSERSLSYFVPVDSEGVYYVTFSAFSAPKNDSGSEFGNDQCSFSGRKPTGSAEKVNGRDSIWFSSTYVVVKKPRK
ncbi:hypothetical protein [Pseudomonas hunanensis]|uniref:hypothetical protein n=1 Tax=Pseudomonas hunanensis TaxID=1247546 RepID=UPI0030D96C7B